MTFGMSRELSSQNVATEMPPLHFIQCAIADTLIEATPVQSAPRRSRATES